MRFHTRRSAAAGAGCNQQDLMAKLHQPGQHELQILLKPTAGTMPVVEQDCDSHPYFGTWAAIRAVLATISRTQRFTLISMRVFDM